MHGSYLLFLYSIHIKWFCHVVGIISMARMSLAMIQVEKLSLNKRVIMSIYSVPKEQGMIWAIFGSHTF